MNKLYLWQGEDKLGEKCRGKILGFDKKTAQKQLQQQGIDKIKLFRNWQFSFKPSSQEVSDFFNQLAFLLQAKIPLKTALQMLHKDCINPILQLWLSQILNELQRGSRFSTCLMQLKNSHYFIDNQEQQLLTVGEMTGKLGELCQQIAHHKQQKLQLQRKIQKILLYPSIVLSISLILTLLLLIFIVPQFAELYGGTNQSLPFFTQILLSISLFLRQQFLWLLILLPCLFLIIQKIMKTYPQIKQIPLKIFPALQEIYQLSRLIKLSLGLGLMLQSGIPLPQALQSFLNPLNDTKFNRAIEFCLKGIHRGFPFSASVSYSLFPQQAKQMLQIGEQTGQVAQMLFAIGQNAQRKLDHQIDLLSQLIEPLLMVIVGSIIALIMLGMYLPIFNMGSLIQ